MKKIMFIALGLAFAVAPMAVAQTNTIEPQDPQTLEQIQKQRELLNQQQQSQAQQGQQDAKAAKKAAQKQEEAAK